MVQNTFDLQRLKRSFVGVSGLYLIGVPLLVLANIVLARCLSVEDFGTFGFAISLATVLAIPVSGGLPLLLNREVSRYARQGNWGAYRGLVLTAFRWVGAVSLAIWVSFAIWTVISGALPGQQELIVLLLVPLLGMAAVRNGILKGLGRPTLAEAPQQILQPSLMIMGYLMLASLGLATDIHALWWYLTVVILTFACASIMLWRVQPAEVHDIASDNTDLPRWKASILPFVMISAANVLSTQIAVLILGINGMDEAVAQMRVAERGAQLVAFPLTFINSIIGPYFVQSLESYRETGDKGPMRRMARQSALLTLAASLPIALILLIFGKPLLALTFGAPYDEASYLPMAIIIVAQVASVSLGNGGMLLAMGGNEKQTLYSLLLSSTIIGTTCLALVDSYGATGAAIAASTGIVSAKLFVYFGVRRRYGISSGVLCLRSPSGPT